MEFEKTTHDHTALDRALFLLSHRVQADEDGALGEAWPSLARDLKHHFDDEEANFFPLLRRELPAYEEEVDALLTSHGHLRALIDEVSNAPPGALGRAAFVAFRQAFEQHSLAEADLVHRTWNTLFPELNAGG